MLILRNKSMNKKQLKTVVKALITEIEDLRNRIEDDKHVLDIYREQLLDKENRIQCLKQDVENAPQAVSLEDIACLIHPDVNAEEKIKIIRAATGAYQKEASAFYDMHFRYM